MGRKLSTKKKLHDSCTIRRTFKRTHGTLSLQTGKCSEDRSEIVTEPCNTPLFEDLAKETGICRSCAEGWEHPENKFASKEEKARAMARKS